MNKELMKFWITCPKCKHKFGIEPRIIMKYLERVMDKTGKKIDALADLLESAQAEIEEKKED